MTKATETGLALLRKPFPPNQISKLPRPTPRQRDELKSNRNVGIRCELCGQWHHKDAIHLDYVGHAALTDRLLDADPHWNWEPVAFDQHGRPAQDGNGGMWIKLTVCGVTRYGYGHPDGKQGGDAIKEVIGDALRNAAMRFGAALDLWHKGDLHAEDDDGNAATGPARQAPRADAKPAMSDAEKRDAVLAGIAKRKTTEQLRDFWERCAEGLQTLPEPMQLQCKKAYSDAMDRAHDDPAGQAPANMENGQ